jgi:AcrR family transcriptional regulator
MLSETGVAELSLRAVARRAMVSAMAPYRHFADKEALLAAVAEHGFRELTARLAAAAATADPRARLMAQGVAYVLFARDEQSLFKLMFGPAIAQKKSTYPGLTEAADEAFGALRRAVEAVGFFGGSRSLEDASLACWSLVHGLSTLIVDCRLVGHDDDVEAVAARVTRLLVDGFAALGRIQTS